MDAIVSQWLLAVAAQTLWQQGRVGILGGRRLVLANEYEMKFGNGVIAKNCMW